MTSIVNVRYGEGVFVLFFFDFVTKGFDGTRSTGLVNFVA